MRAIHRPVTALLMSAALVAAVCVAAAPPAAASAAAPPVIPALASWTPAGGSLELSAATRIVVDGNDPAARQTAETFAADLRAARPWPVPVVPAPGAGRPGDIVLRHDTGRTDLGAEGYAMAVGDRISLTGATAAGLFYATRTVLQLLAAGNRVPTGSAVDVPKYAERGVALCACYTYYTVGWIERLIKDMAYLKLNYLHLEIKVRSAQFPGINTFSYYTDDEIRQIVALATKYHITVVPEINSPGHIDPYIENYPDLQLVDSSGVADPTRLDVTKPEAFDFYTSLIDEYLKLFPGKYWHMGADEYMLGSAYADYPQLLAYAQAKYGPGAVAQDAYVDFINRVDAYVRARGRTLRIWNDGLTGDNTVPLNQDVTVEYWTGETVSPQDLLDAGHTVMNASDALYYVRGGYGPDTESLYDSGWSPVDFPGQTVAAGQAVPGAEFTIWPDDYGAETENTTQANVFMPLRFVAQATWGSPDPTADYAGFEQLADAIGHAPGWGPAWVQPVPGGSYQIRDNGGALTAPSTVSSALVVRHGKETWTLQPTDDGYYRLVSGSTGLCADMRRGTPNRLGVVEQEGAAVTAETCDGGTTQEWQIEPVPGGYRIVDAITQEAADVQSGNVVQEPRSAAHDDVWQVVR
jgi:hexosaminidase